MEKKRLHFVTPLFPLRFRILSFNSFLQRPSSSFLLTFFAFFPASFFRSLSFRTFPRLVSLQWKPRNGLPRAELARTTVHQPRTIDSLVWPPKLTYNVASSAMLDATRPKEGGAAKAALSAGSRHTAGSITDLPLCSTSNVETFNDELVVRMRNNTGIDDLRFSRTYAIGQTARIDLPCHA